LDEHIEHIDKVLTLLEENSIRLRLSKCFFAKNELEYLGHMVSEEGLKPTDSKIKAVTEWPTPKSVQNVQQWLGFCNFYRRYINNYSLIAAPLYQLTKKDKASFEWDISHQQAFVKLKSALTMAPLLRNPSCGQNEEFYISTDASKYAVGAVLLQIKCQWSYATMCIL
jgi:hypothetical protein